MRLGVLSAKKFGTIPVTVIPRFSIDVKSFVTAKYPYDNVCDNIVFKKNEN